MTSERNAVRNKLLRWVGGRRSGDVAVVAGPQYGHASPEGQTRRLADLAFMLQDYGTAHQALRWLAAEYETVAPKHYASVQVG